MCVGVCVCSVYMCGLVYMCVCGVCGLVCMCVYIHAHLCVFVPDLFDSKKMELACLIQSHICISQRVWTLGAVLM